MKITKFHPSHLSALVPAHGYERELLANITKEQVAVMADGPAVTLWNEMRPVACAGVMGECELWGVMDSVCQFHGMSVFKAARQFIGKFRWLYARVDPNFEAGCNLLEHLGFKFMGIQVIGGVASRRYERSA